ncbi:DUF6090 family protein [uncultured Winogradskyella sp.]|uniref:DUF6090 family protein n=1 Tax=uncultured Winogradskyella sp. TaxID=395353 RepID=UPI00260F9999|nr:DUF6090 family protein [uncultured Winogradskyella sp.]
MIKFFRKIRQKMLTENKFSKYLIYAIGEIILVVIGILIALQINNWNENNKTRNQELALLKSLKFEMEENVIMIDLHLEYLNNMKLNYDRILSLTNPNYIEKKEDSLQYALTNIFTISTFLPKNTELNAAQNSNSIRLIRNKKITTGLSKWILQSEFVINFGSTANEYYNNTLVPTVLNYYQLKNITYDRSNGNNGTVSKHKSNLEKLFRNRVFENNLYRMNTLIRIRASYAADLKVETLNLIQLLNKELNN